MSTPDGEGGKGGDEDGTEARVVAPPADTGIGDGAGDLEHPVANVAVSMAHPNQLNT